MSHICTGLWRERRREMDCWLRVRGRVGGWRGRREFALSWRGLMWPEEVTSPMARRGEFSWLWRGEGWGFWAGGENCGFLGQNQGILRNGRIFLPEKVGFGKAKSRNFLLVINLCKNYIVMFRKIVYKNCY
jgi:hypothetical protein